MANIRCPMCSKLNPPEAEVCSYCGARLKPLHLGQSGQPAPEPSKSDEPDWLSQLRTGGQGSFPEDETDGKSAEPDQAGADVPEWLARIRDRAKVETGDQEDEPDWMRGLQSESEPPADQGLDDWLNRIPGSQSAQPGESTPPDQPQATGEAAPSDQQAESADWLRNLSNELPQEPASEASSAFDSGASETGAAGEEDWMSKLSAWQADLPDKDAANPPEGTPPLNPQDDFGWLDEGDKAPSEPPDQPVSSGTGLTGFLSSLEPPDQQPPAFTSGEGAPSEGEPQEGGIEWSPPQAEPTADQSSSELGITDFLSSFIQPDVPQEQPGEMNEDAFPGWEKPSGAEQGEGMSDWFSSDKPGQEAEATPFVSDETIGSAQGTGAGETDLSDWLKNLESETPGQAAPEPFTAEEAGAPAETEMGVPDWLKGAAGEPPSAQGESEPFSAGQEGLPGWLSESENTEAPPPAQAPAGAPGQPEAGESSLPAWLLETEDGSKAQAPASESSITQPAGEETAEEPGAETFAAADLPAWLGSNFTSAAETPESTPEETSGESAHPGAGEEGLPDWFASFEEKDVEKTQPSRTGRLKPAETGAPGGEQPPASTAAEEVGAAQFEGMPDWLSGFQDQQAPDTTGEIISPLIGGEKALEDAGKGAETGDQPFTVDLPEWLGEDAEARPAEAVDQPVEAGGEPLAQAELPEWVKEMRPLESILPGEGVQAEVDQRVEKSGPLAGMRGVLPVDDIASRYRKPPIYSVKLRVTEKQRTQATLLESILAQESQPLLIPPEPSRATGVIIRVLVALFLLVVLAFPVVFDVKALAMPSPDLFPAENQMFQSINERLQANAPVLVAVEYEPSLSGEMRIAASPVIEQLVQKNARIVLVSTLSAGPALGQQLVNGVAAGHLDYNVADQVVNLGYLPGGTISLVDFAQQPSRAAPATLGFKPAWTETFLKNVAGLGDFSQVIVLTDRAEIGRAWVELVQPQLGQVPLLMVVSAQAAPLLQPYYESGQVAGLTSGLLGGVIYAQKIGQSNSQAELYFPAYQIGVIVALAVVLIGGLISGAISLFRGKGREEE